MRRVFSRFHTGSHTHCYSSGRPEPDDIPSTGTRGDSDSNFHGPSSGITSGSDSNHRADPWGYPGGHAGTNANCHARRDSSAAGRGNGHPALDADQDYSSRKLYVSTHSNHVGCCHPGTDRRTSVHARASYIYPHAGLEFAIHFYACTYPHTYPGYHAYAITDSSGSLHSSAHSYSYCYPYLDTKSDNSPNCYAPADGGCSAHTQSDADNPSAYTYSCSYQSGNRN